MNDRTFSTLEFDKILSQLKEYAVSDKTKRLINPEMVSNEIGTVRQMIDEVDDASTILRYRNVEMAGISDVKEHVNRAVIGSMLSISDFNDIKNLLFRKQSLNKVSKSSMRTKWSLMPSGIIFSACRTSTIYIRKLSAQPMRRLCLTMHPKISCASVGKSILRKARSVIN